MVCITLDGKVGKIAILTGMSQIYCSNCGQLIPNNSNFCKFCGVPQHGPDAAVYHAQAPVAQTPVEAQAAAANLKPVELFPKQHLGPDSIAYFFFSFLSKTILLLILSVVGAALMPKIFIFVLIGYFVVLFLGVMFAYNNFTFEIDETGLTIQSGVIHKSQVSLPFDQVQNVNIERTLLDRLLGLSKVSIETAGSAMGTTTNGTAAPGGKVKAEAFLPGLHLDTAKKIHDLLIDGSDGVLGDD